MKKNMNRVTVICLGVIDMKKSLQFYRDKLGFKTDETGDNPDVVLFSTPGTKLELYPLDLLAKDIDRNSIMISGGHATATRCGSSIRASPAGR